MVTAEFLPTVVSKLQGTTVSPLVIYSTLLWKRREDHGASPLFAPSRSSSADFGTMFRS